jgi:DOPA 4,5-dioxygenase
MVAPEPATIAGYHAHIYFEESSAGHAAEIRETIAARFDVEMGRWHDRLVGPHTRSMYQVAFSTDTFAEFVPWLMIHHGDLAVLIHPTTGDDLPDHTDYALWLGEKLDLDLSVL